MNLPLLEGVHADAMLSDCGTYRYLLTRDWFPKDRGEVLWVMLNPSTADADVDDRTVRKCQKFARSWGFDGMSVVNLFALRSTQPAELYRHPAPVGPLNDDVIVDVATSPRTELVVAAWGVHGAHMNRGIKVLDLLAAAGVTPMRLGRPTKGGHPWHPLYRPDDIALEPAA